MTEVTIDKVKRLMKWDKHREPTLLEYLRYYRAGYIQERHIEAAIREVMEGVIGRDRTAETDDTTPGRYKTNKYIVAENRLRAEQRARLNKVIPHE